MAVHNTDKIKVLLHMLSGMLYTFYLLYFFSPHKNPMRFKDYHAQFIDEETEFQSC